MSRLSRFIHFYTDEDEGNGGGGDLGIEKTVKASLVHVEDALAKNAKMVKAYIEPVQSGSGDPSPDNVRPITGHTGVNVVRTGKNLLDPNNPKYADTLVGTDGTKNSNSNFNTWMTDLSSCTISITVTETQNPGRVVVFNSDNTVASSSGFSATVGRRAISISLTSGQYALISIRKSATEYQLEAGNETTYEAYQGTTYSVNFPALTANQWDEQWETGGISSTTGENVDSNNRYRSVNYIAVEPSQQLYVVAPANLGLRLYNNSKEFLRAETGVANAVYTVPSDVYFIRFINTSASTYGNNVSLNYPSSVTTYVPYTNTVYSGTLDLTTGVLTVDKAIVDMGSLSYNYDSTNDFFTVTPSGIKTPLDSISEELCSIYKINSGISDSAMATAGTGIYLVLSNGKHKIKDTRYSSGSDLATALTGQKLIYPLATPLTYQLTPTQITMLLGENNLWNDANGDTEVTYLASS